MYALYHTRSSFISQSPKIPSQCLTCLRQPPGLCSAFGFRSQCPGDILSIFQEWFGTASRRVQMSSGHSQGCLISIFFCYCLHLVVVLGDIPCANFRCSPRYFDLFRPCDMILSRSLKICLIFWKSVPEQFN